jgi:hypothetical protein
MTEGQRNLTNGIPSLDDMGLRDLPTLDVRVQCRAARAAINNDPINPMGATLIGVLDQHGGW